MCFPSIHAAPLPVVRFRSRYFLPWRRQSLAASHGSVWGAWGHRRNKGLPEHTGLHLRAQSEITLNSCPIAFSEAAAPIHTGPHAAPTTALVSGSVSVA